MDGLHGAIGRGGMSTLSLAQATQFAQQAGFSGQGLQNILAIAQAESGLNPSAQNCNNPGGSCDRGILQINNSYHSEVTNQCAYDPACAFAAAFKISGGNNFSQWTTFQNGAYKQYLGNSGSSPAGNNANPTPSGSSSNCAAWDIQCLIGAFTSSNTVRQAGLLFIGLVVVLIGLAIVFFGGK